MRAPLARGPGSGVHGAGAVKATPACLTCRSAAGTGLAFARSVDLYRGTGTSVKYFCMQYKSMYSYFIRLLLHFKLLMPDCFLLIEPAFGDGLLWFLLSRATALPWSPPRGATVCSVLRGWFLSAPPAVAHLGGPALVFLTLNRRHILLAVNSGGIEPISQGLKEMANFSQRNCSHNRTPN